jgi:hypothetical protein
VADPAVGTGTFLLGVFRQIAETVASDQGAGAVPGAISVAARRLIGFEIQFGPFAVAQLRLIAEMDALIPKGQEGSQCGAVSNGDNATCRWLGSARITHDSLFGLHSERDVAPRQRDLFQDDESDLFDEDAPTPEYHADPDEVRAELHAILAEARAAHKLPWEPRKVALYRTIFPQMTLWLPEEEAAQLRFEFETELERLKAA